MSRRRDIENRLALYEDLSGILGAMRSFALAELHRLGRRESAQQAVVQRLGETLDSLRPLLPPIPQDGADVWVLLGSARGFCASFNEDVARHWQVEAPAAAPVVAVGERLQACLLERGIAEQDLFPVAGPLGCQDASGAVDRLLAAIGEARRHPATGSGLMLCFRDADGARSERLLPLAGARPGKAQPLPRTYDDPARVARQVAEHWLLHGLLAGLLQSIRQENHMRLTQMENALQHLERNGELLRRRRNLLRQEEIVEEIELIVQEGGTD